MGEEWYKSYENLPSDHAMHLVDGQQAHSVFFGVVVYDLSPFGCHDQFWGTEHNGDIACFQIWNVLWDVCNTDILTFANM